MDALALYGSESSSSSDNDDDQEREESVSQSIIPMFTESEARRNEVFARNVPHTVGNWAGYVYLDLDWRKDNSQYNDDDDDHGQDQGSSDWVQCRQRWIHHLRDHLQSQKLPIQALVLHDSCHVSLSKTFYLQSYNIESFVKSLQDALALCSVKSPLTLRVQANPPVVLSNAADLPSGAVTDKNQDGTASLLRTFWCAQVHPPLIDLVTVVNGVLGAWQLPPFYDPPQFHTSWASAPGDWTTARPLPSLPPETLLFTIAHVTCRIGDKVFRIPLSSFK